MAGVMNEVCLHLVWATWDRQPLLTRPVRAMVYRQIVAKAKEHGCPVLAIGGIEDHVHVVVRFATTITISDLVQHVKGSSSRLVDRAAVAHGHAPFFKWQGGYGVFPVEPESLTRVIRYVENQESHHRERTTDERLERAPRPVEETQPTEQPDKQSA